MHKRKGAPREGKGGGKRPKNAHKRFRNWKKHTKLFNTPETVRGVFLTGSQHREDNMFAEMWYPEQYAVWQKFKADQKAKKGNVEEEEEEEHDPGDKHGKFFEIINPGTVGAVFVSFVHPDVNPTKFVHRIFSYLHDGTLPRPSVRIEHVSRIIPIEAVCEATGIDSAVEMSRPIIRREFSDDKPLKYCVRVEIRNNENFEKMKAIDALATVVGKPHIVNLTDPDRLVMLQVMKSAAAIAIMPDYNKLKKYNLQEILKKDEPKAPTTTTTETTTTTTADAPTESTDTKP